MTCLKFFLKIEGKLLERDKLFSNSRILTGVVQLSSQYPRITFKLRKLNYKYDRKIDIEHGCIKKI